MVFAHWGRQALHALLALNVKVEFVPIVSAYCKLGIPVQQLINVKMATVPILRVVLAFVHKVRQEPPAQYQINVKMVFLVLIAHAYCLLGLLLVRQEINV